MGNEVRFKGGPLDGLGCLRSEFRCDTDTFEIFDDDAEVLATYCRSVDDPDLWEFYRPLYGPHPCDLNAQRIPPALLMVHHGEDANSN